MFFPTPESIWNIRENIINQNFLKIINFLLQQFIRKLFSNFCKIEFNQPSYWLYSVPNLLVF